MRKICFLILPQIIFSAELCGDILTDSQRYEGKLFPEVQVNGQAVDYAKCIYPVNKKLSWFDANVWCKENVREQCESTYCKGKLVSVHSTNQDQQLLDYIHQTIGNTGPTYVEYWLGMRQPCSTCGFEWSDMSPVDYTNWNDGEPNNAGDGEECVQAYDWDYQLTGFTWNDDDCNKAFNFVCEAYTEKYHVPVDPWLPNGKPTTNGCKNGWQKFGGGCFRIFGDRNSGEGHNTPLSWHEANAHCQQVWPGASLAVLPNVHYQWFVTSLLVSVRNAVWIGLQNISQDRQFHWVDKSRLNFDNWAPGEPNGHELDFDEDVVEMYSYTHGTYFVAGEWNDRAKGEKRSYMCSHQAVPQESGTGSIDCPTGWFSSRHFCYKLFVDAKNFEDSRSDCQGQPVANGLKGKNGDLVSVVDEFEFNLVRALLYPELEVFGPTDGNDERPGAWIGLTAYKATKDDGPIGVGDIVYSWTDKFPFATTWWAARQPNQTYIVNEPEKTCFFLNLPSGGWANSGATTCIARLPRICKINLDDYNPAKKNDHRGKHLPCLENWTSIDGLCHRAFPEKVSWFEAESKCVQYWGHLSSVHSSSKNTQLTQLFQAVGGSSDSFWVGGKRNELFGMSWTDLTDFSYTNWDYGEPSYDWNGHPEDCVAIKGTGFWNDDHCDRDYHGFVCEVQQVYENCAAVAEIDRKSCGGGLTPLECDYKKCCWDASSTIHCFKPKGAKKDNDMTAGKAAGIVAGVCLSLILVTVVYFVFIAGVPIM